jgi:hypothetical protein
MITLQKIGDAIKFTFSGNTHYLQDGTVEVPVNSLSLTIDDSGFATFRKSASNDIFISATYGELGMTKDELVAWYKENMVDGGGSDITSGDVQNMIDASISGKQDTLIAGENISISGNVISAEGDSITIDPSLDSGSTNPVANSAITNAIDAKANKGVFSGISITLMNEHPGAKFNKDNGEFNVLWLSRINGTRVFETGSLYTQAKDFSLVETSAITTSVTSASTDAQVPSAKAVYDALQEGGGGNNVVELTQAEYDALVSGGTVDPTAFYIITDATPVDLSTKVDTSAFTAYSAATDATLSGKQDTLSAGTGIEISGNVISATGGGSTYTAGEGIIITGSSNAITLDANIYKGNGIASVSVNNPSGSGNGYNKISGMTSFGAGWMVATNNIDEAAFGYFNKSNGASQQFIHSSGNTLFSVGNGADNARHNAFEIRQNGDIYCSDGTNDVKLQDTITATAANTTALGGLKLVKLTQAQYDALATKDNSTLYVIVN